MKFLVTNDDGFDAQGLQVLAKVASEFGQVVVIAPEECHSSCGHKVTTARDLRVREVRKNWLALDGAPADCARIGLLHLATDVDWILSGLNHGANLGIDVIMSGTVAAVRESRLLGYPGIAFSHYRRNREIVNWVRAERWIRSILPEILSRGRNESPASDDGARAIWNVNLPDPEGPEKELPSVVYCPIDPSPLPVRFEREGDCFRFNAVYRDRMRLEGHDVGECLGGKISISPIRHGW